MPLRRYRWTGETPVTIPDMAWGDAENPVMPGDVSAPFDGEVNNELLVPLDDKKKAAGGDS